MSGDTNRADAHAARIPVAVLTGFLGSGKTTLLARLLRHPDFSRTAVIINEFGEVGLDHDLVEASEESFVTLQTGCLCCSVRGDLVLTLAAPSSHAAAINEKFPTSAIAVLTHDVDWERLDHGAAQLVAFEVPRG